MEKKILSNDPFALDKLKERYNQLKEERESMRQFNIKARKNKTKPIPYNELVNKKNLSSWFKKRIQDLERLKEIENENFKSNGVDIVKDYNNMKLQFYFKEQPSYKIIKVLTNKSFEFNKKLKCWEKTISNKDNYEFLNLFKKS